MSPKRTARKKTAPSGPVVPAAPLVPELGGPDRWYSLHRREPVMVETRRRPTTRRPKRRAR